jgi:pyruvate dehydrogenase E2 component (dihydrolipoamide acetyltransferase)
MATMVHMEALSPTMEEGQLVRWLKREGDTVSEGDVIAEIETDKATMELVARGSGVLQGIRLQEGQSAPVGAVIAVIGAAGDAVAGEAGDAAAAAAVAESAGAGAAGGAAVAAAAAVESAVAGAAVAARPERHPAGAERIRASPLARRLAAESAVDLSAVAGSGPGGRITKRDIEAAAAAGAPVVVPVPAPAAVSQPVPAGPDTEEVPVTQMRRTIAKRLAQSIGPIPTYYLTIECDMTRLIELRQRANQRLEKDGVRASINDFIIKAVAAALAQHPEVNASWGDNAIVRHHRVHIGVAVAVEDGLITPIVRDADRKRIREIAVEVKELAGRARERKLRPDEYTGATFSISNLGMFGIIEFTAIINPPEAGILAVGAVEEKPVVENGQVVVRPRMRMTMSCDHRVIDGATGAKFLQTVQELVEDPLAMIA